MNKLSDKRNSQLLSTTVRIIKQKKSYLLYSIIHYKTETAGTNATQRLFKNRHYLQHWNELRVTKQKTCMY